MTDDGRTQAPARIDYLDFLKVIGLAGLFIAHAEPPGWMLMLRSFDVPLLVMISAILARRSYARLRAGGKSAAAYCLGRFRRLVIPTWIFLAFYFLLYRAMGGQFQSLRYYVDSFLLTRYGVAYVWIILVYLFCALLIPLLDRLPLTLRGALTAAAAYAVYEAAWTFGIGKEIPLIESTFYYIIPYGAVTWLGYRWPEMKGGTRRCLAGAALLVFAALAGWLWIRSGAPQQVQTAKYPPRLYYLSYGIGCSAVLLMLCGSRPLRLYSAGIIRFISSHSLWIYLWQILMLGIYDRSGLPSAWYLKFLTVSAGAVLVTWGVNAVLDAAERKKKIAFFKYLRG